MHVAASGSQMSLWLLDGISGFRAELRTLTESLGLLFSSLDILYFYYLFCVC